MVANSREAQKLRTQEKLVNAIDRLITGTAKSKKLRTHKLNDNNVVIEAGLATGALKHYPRVRQFIAIKINYPSAIWTEDGAFIDMDTQKPVQDNVSINKAENKIKELKGDVKKAVEVSGSYREQQSDIYKAMKNQLALHHSLTIALFDAIPDDVKESKLKEFENNVVIGNFATWGIK